VQRFISADSVDYLGYNGGVAGYNMYSYCGNNPVVRADYNGEWWEIILLVVVAFVGCFALSGCSKNADGSLPKFNPNQDFGNLKAYNCYAYAMGISDKWLHPGKGVVSVIDNHYNLKNKSYEMPSYYTVEQLRQWVIQDFGSDIVRSLKKRNSRIEQNEYRIAMRVNIKPYAFYNIVFLITTDFHFMKQHEDGRWSHKQGSGCPVDLGLINPDNYDWGYSSGTLYAAVKII
jgi:hypothetical protein